MKREKMMKTNGKKNKCMREYVRDITRVEWEKTWQWLRKGTSRDVQKY